MCFTNFIKSKWVAHDEIAQLISSAFCIEDLCYQRIAVCVLFAGPKHTDASWRKSATVICRLPLSRKTSEHMNRVWQYVFVVNASIHLRPTHLRSSARSVTLNWQITGNTISSIGEMHQLTGRDRTMSSILANTVSSFTTEM